MLTDLLKQRMSVGPKMDPCGTPWSALVCVKDFSLVWTNSIYGLIWFEQTKCSSFKGHIFCLFHPFRRFSIDQKHPSLQRHSPAPPGGFWGVPRPGGIYNPGSGSASSQFDLWNNLQMEATRRHPKPDAQTTSADSFHCRGAAALLRAPSGCTNASP